VQQVKTNILDVFATNHVTRTLTNVVDVFATNHLVKNLTNKFIVDLVQTNLVRAYHTNFQALNVTNWTTVLMFKTNWVTQPMTNLVEIDMPAPNPVSSSVPKNATSEIGASQTLDSTLEPLVIEASKGARLGTTNQFEVRLSVRWATPKEAPLQVLQWRAEREDGSFLCFGQDSEFRHAMPAGTYKVQVKIHQDAGDPLVGRGTLVITPHEVLIAQKPSVKKSAI
jgi:hypothetical protein